MTDVDQKETKIENGQWNNIEKIPYNLKINILAIPQEWPWNQHWNLIYLKSNECLTFFIKRMKYTQTYTFCVEMEKKVYIYMKEHSQKKKK